MDFRLPPLGEGIDTATVTAVLVRPGEVVQPGQNVVTVETDKAAVEVPVDVAGVVDAVLVKPGDKIPIDTPILRLRTPGKSPSSNTSATAAVTSPSSTPFNRQENTPPAAPNKASPTNEHGGSSSLSPTPPPFIPAVVQGSGRSVVTEVLLPVLGEGIEAATVTAVLVQPGDVVQPGQNLLTVETDKAAVEVPADQAGVVETVFVKAGDKVPVGGRVLALRPLGTTPSSPSLAANAPAPTTPLAPTASPPVATRTVDGQQTTLANHTTPSPPVSTSISAWRGGDLIPASPATRRLARELGVSLSEVPPSGRGGRVTLDDVKNFVRSERQRFKQIQTPAIAVGDGSVASAPGLPPLPDFSKYGPIDVQEVSILRQTIARNLSLAWRTIPMVTQHEVADITELEAGRKRVLETLPPDSPKITMTVLAIKACVAALKEYPQFNSSYDSTTNRLILKRYYHIGIAVDTKEGLVVPVVRDADKKSIRELAAEVQLLADKARGRKLSLEEMRGGTFTISNLGGIGGTAFTPIVNYPEVAILGISRSQWQAVVREGQIVPRLLLPLSLTYDHRVIDGADGCRFLVRVAQLLSDPLRLLFQT